MGVPHHDQAGMAESHDRFVVANPVLDGPQRGPWHSRKLLRVPQPRILAAGGEPIDRMPRRGRVLGDRDVRIMLGERREGAERATRHVQHRLDLVD